MVNLFAEPLLNHHTAVQGGLLADDCTAVLQQFFRQRRSEQRATSRTSHPLRDDALRTPDAAFIGLLGFPWTPHYVSDLPALAGLRLHYLNEPGTTGDAGQDRLTFLCLHGGPAWSYQYRHMIPIWLAAGHRVVAPDLIGFGKSDKPKKDSFHTFDRHRQSLLELVEALDLRQVVLVVQDGGGLLGLSLPIASPKRYQGLLVMNTLPVMEERPMSPGFPAWPNRCAQNSDLDVARWMADGNPHLNAPECAAYSAPFPDRGHCAALRAFANLVPDHLDDPRAAMAQLTRDFWRDDWHGRTLMAVGLQDPVLGLRVAAPLQKLIRGCPPAMLLPQAGHFLHEQGAAMATETLRIFAP